MNGADHHQGSADHHQQALDLRPWKPSRAERFAAFDAANPEVYERLRELALFAKHRGRTVGIRLLWERLRWELFVELEPTKEGFRLNDHFPPFYARLLNADPALTDFFETRETHV